MYVFILVKESVAYVFRITTMLGLNIIMGIRVSLENFTENIR